MYSSAKFTDVIGYWKLVVLLSIMTTRALVSMGRLLADGSMGNNGMIYNG